MRELTPEETRIANAVGRKLLELGDEHAPTHVAVHRDLFLHVGEIHGLKVIRAGYLPRDQAALMVVVDDTGRTIVPRKPRWGCEWHGCTMKADTERTDLGGTTFALCWEHERDGEAAGYWRPRADNEIASR